METIEQEIEEIFEKLLKKYNADFIFSYTYEKQNGEKAEIEGRVGVYGSREVIDVLIEELQGKIEENTKDNFVNV